MGRKKAGRIYSNTVQEEKHGERHNGTGFSFVGIQDRAESLDTPGIHGFVAACTVAYALRRARLALKGALVCIHYGLSLSSHVLIALSPFFGT